MSFTLILNSLCIVEPLTLYAAAPVGAVINTVSLLRGYLVLVPRMSQHVLCSQKILDTFSWGKGGYWILFSLKNSILKSAINLFVFGVFWSNLSEVGVRSLSN